MAKFEKIQSYTNDDSLLLPTRKTQYSAGYDIAAAEDILIPSYSKLLEKMKNEELKTFFSFPGINSTTFAFYLNNCKKTLEEMASITKLAQAKPTLIPTGIKCKLEQNQYLELSVRSSSPLKYWLILANGVGIIDADYYNNPDNEGHIYFQVINLSPFDIIIKKGEIIGQGIIKTYSTTEDETTTDTARTGGFGSTT